VVLAVLLVQVERLVQVVLAERLVRLVLAGQVVLVVLLGQVVRLDRQVPLVHQDLLAHLGQVVLVVKTETLAALRLNIILVVQLQTQIPEQVVFYYIPEVQPKKIQLLESIYIMMI
jgi:hypothetical protein